MGPEGVAASLEYRMKHLNAFQPKPTTRRLHCRPVALSNEITHTPRMPAAIIPEVGWRVKGWKLRENGGKNRASRGESSGPLCYCQLTL